MMLNLVTTAQFRKDYKRIKKRGYDVSLLEAVIDTLLEEKPLEQRYRDHILTGNYAGFRECHIPPGLAFHLCHRQGQPYSNGIPDRYPFGPAGIAGHP